LATVIAIRAVRPYRPFPSVDDFAYLPLAWAWRDPRLFPRDTLLRGFVHHTPAWDVIVRVLDATVGEPLGFWLLTLLLTVATVVAVGRLLRATGVSLVLLPVVAALAFCGPVIGFGRGAYDGALGDAFHVQWLALCALLWCYDAFVRERMVASGAWLGAAALCHPVVAAHGALVLGVGGAVAGGRRWGRLPLLAGIAAVVSLPLSIPLIRSVTGSASAVARMAPDVIRLGYVFRNPLHYLPGLTPASTWWYLGVMILGGLAAALVPRTGPEQRNIRALAALLAGQAMVAASGPLIYGDWMPERWRYASSLPYMLDLSRTSGLILPLAAVLLVGALELRPSRRDQATPTHELLWIGLFAVAATALIFFVTWSRPLATLVVVGLIGRAWGPGPRATAAVAVGLIAVAALGLARIHGDTRLRAPLSPEEAGLYHWAAGTPTNALFIVPPGLQGFRFYGRRSVYVDFKLFPPATPSSSPEWRRRMEQVAAPDRLALRSPGWSGVPQWDRTYANRNTPARIVSLLGETGADYLVWDRSGLDLPPYVPIERPGVPGLALTFQNARFEVYALAKR
jgi:hypothetical protein